MRLLPAIDEAIRIAREAKMPAEIWHLKGRGKEQLGTHAGDRRADRSARRLGVDISANTYAYTAWFNSFFGVHSALGARWRRREADRAAEGSGHARAHPQRHGRRPARWDNEWQEIAGPEAILVSVVQNPKLVPLQGKTIAEIAKLWNKDPIDTIFDLLIEDNAFTSVAVFGMSEPDVTLALQQPWVSICNDSQGTAPDGLLGREHPHPRAYGTFPHILRKYVREEGKLRLEDAIRKFSALPAQKLQLTDRGVLKKGHVGRHRDVRSGYDSR